MRGIVENGAPVPAFLVKLWKMVDDEDTNHLITWSDTGETFIIKDQANFSAYLIPLFYKHSNMASFIRQLNMYGFRKVSNVENGSLRGDKEEVEFCHEYFKQNNPHLLELIKRKTPPKASANNNYDVINQVLDDLDQMKDRQVSVNSQLSLIKQQNVALWREVIMLRRKHEKQQQIVNKLIQFILTLVQPSGRSNLGSIPVKRKFPLMIYGQDVDNSANKTRKMSDSDSAGPTIHELDTADALFNDDFTDGNAQPTVQLAGNEEFGNDDEYYDDFNGLTSNGIKFEPLDDTSDMFYDVKPNVSDYITIDGKLRPVISLKNGVKLVKPKDDGTKNASKSNPSTSTAKKPTLLKLQPLRSQTDTIKINLDDGIKILDNINAHVNSAGSANGVKNTAKSRTGKSTNMNVALITNNKVPIGNVNGKKPIIVIRNDKDKYAGLLKHVQNVQKNQRQNVPRAEKMPATSKENASNVKSATVMKTNENGATTMTKNDLNRWMTKKINENVDATGDLKTPEMQDNVQMNNNSNVEDVLNQLLSETFTQNEPTTPTPIVMSPTPSPIVTSSATPIVTSPASSHVTNPSPPPSPFSPNFFNDLISSPSPSNALISGKEFPSASTSNLNPFMDGSNQAMDKRNDSLKVIDTEIETMQSELEQLTDILNNEGYTLDASEFLSMFDGDSMADMAMPSANNELMTYNPTLDFSTILDSEEQANKVNE